MSALFTFGLVLSGSVLKPNKKCCSGVCCSLKTSKTTTTPLSSIYLLFLAVLAFILGTHSFTELGPKSGYRARGCCVSCSVGKTELTRTTAIN